MSARTRFLRLLTAARHRARPSRRQALLAVPLLVVPLLATPMLTVAPAYADSAATAPSAAGTPAPGAKTVTMLTGEQVQVNPDGTDVLDRSDPALSYVAPNGDRYLIPALAAPYAGRQLDWSLFDVSAMARDSITDGAQIPVTVSLTSASATPPPGITVTSTVGSTAIGYLTPSSAPELAAYLHSQIAADTAAGRPAGSTALPGISRIALGASVPSQVTPAYSYNIVQLNTPGLTGAAHGIIQLWNVDSFQRVSVMLPSTGLARVALPAGNYFALAQFTDFDDQGNLTALRYVSDGFTVPGSSGTTTFVNLAEGTATAPSTVTTPKPAEQINQVIHWGVQDATGAWDTVSLTVPGTAGTTHDGEAGADVYVAPTTSGPPAGRLRYIVQWDGIAPQSGGSYPYPDESSYPYRYDVAFGWDNQIPAGPYQVQQGQLATVNEHVYADPAENPADVSFDKAPIDPVLPSAAGFQPSDQWTRVAPGDFTDYVGTADGGDWLYNEGTGPGYDIFLDSADPQTFAPGHVYSLDWGRGPLAPEWGQHAPRPAELYENCEGCVAESSSGDYLVDMYPSASEDSQQTNYGMRWVESAVTCYINGTQQPPTQYPGCFDQPAFSAGTAPPSQPNTYRMVYDTSLWPSGPDYSQSTATQTDLTFKFQPKTQPPADMTLPDGYQCEQQTGPGTCEILPVLTLGYQLTGDEYNTVSTPVSHMTLTVGHQTFDGIGSQAPITAASVQVSFDGGATWQAAVVGGHGGSYQVNWKNPSSAQGTSPDLKVTATDSIGGSITQVIDNAYTIAAAS